MVSGDMGLFEFKSFVETSPTKVSAIVRFIPKTTEFKARGF